MLFRSTSYADVSIENSTFKRNNVVKEDLEIGGVLYFDKGDILIKGSTFIDNHGSNKGDAVFTYDSNSHYKTTPLRITEMPYTQYSQHKTLPKTINSIMI